MWNPPAAEGYFLCENQNDGTLRFLKLEAGPWHKLDSQAAKLAKDREERRQNAQNDLIGSFKGKTVVLFGTGPQVGRVTREQIEFLRQDENIKLVGINAMPGVCSRYWNLPPVEVFDIVLAADAAANRDCLVAKPWGWDQLNGVTTFTRVARFLPPNQFPVVGAYSPSLCLPELYLKDSITAALNLIIIMMGTPSIPKVCKGPNMAWPLVMARTGYGRVILVGVEHNRYNHVYTKDMRFAINRGKGVFRIPEFPEGEWPDMQSKYEAHREIDKFAKNMNVEIYQTAEWSLIQQYPKKDFEEILHMPPNLHTGVSHAA